MTHSCFRFNKILILFKKFMWKILHLFSFQICNRNFIFLDIFSKRQIFYCLIFVHKNKLKSSYKIYENDQLHFVDFGIFRLIDNENDVLIQKELYRMIVFAYICKIHEYSLFHKYYISTGISSTNKQYLHF